jgi:hypothetical protein
MTNINNIDGELLILSKILVYVFSPKHNHHLSTYIIFLFKKSVVNDALA